MKNSQDQKNFSRKSQDSTHEVIISDDGEEIARNSRQDYWREKSTTILPTQPTPRRPVKEETDKKKSG